METPNKYEVAGNNEQHSPKIVLRFLRHAEREVDPTKEDKDIGLTTKGKETMVERGEGQPSYQNVTFSSPRKRTRETAALLTLAKDHELDGTETIEELQEMAKPATLRIDDSLNYHADDDSEYTRRVQAAFESGTYLNFMIEHSDEAATELNDDTDLTYSRNAAKIAKIIEKYVGLAPRWNNLVDAADKSESHAIERAFVSHGGILESFLAKVIEEKEGLEGRDSFLKAVGGKGFGYADGFTIDIQEDEETRLPVAQIHYSKKIDDENSYEYNGTIDSELLSKISASI